jgi:transposase
MDSDDLVSITRKQFEEYQKLLGRKQKATERSRLFEQKRREEKPEVVMAQKRAWYLRQKAAKEAAQAAKEASASN